MNNRILSSFSPGLVDAFLPDRRVCSTCHYWKSAASYPLVHDDSNTIEGCCDAGNLRTDRKENQDWFRGSDHCGMWRSL